MRLDKYVSLCKKATRSETKKFIRQGNITVNGVVAKKSDMQVDENSVLVCINGEELSYRKYIYLMLNKPAGYISATYDAHQKTIMELIPDEYLHFELFPVGRLDIDTEGLLILTNDGKFAHDLTSPRKHVYKTYYAELDKPMQQGDIEIFKKGIKLDADFTTLPAELYIDENPKRVYIKICEGKFHQVKRMCESVGKKVMYLKRIRIGGLSLDPDLPKGGVRELSGKELRLLTNSNE
ncbi:MAG: rRNA pseudouridine synthase [Clostridia bacterium]|nr:rRNA pseudouridine synthase [Clostridia bacterium]